jgi:GNAT superfamily N-acetyltransferase
MSLKVWVYQKLKNTSRKVEKYWPRLHRELLYDYDLTLNTEEPKSLTDYHLVDISHDKLSDLLTIWNLDLKVLSERLDRGDHCYVAYYGSEAVSYHWVQTLGVHFIQPLNQTISINKKQLWIYHVRVAKEFRGKGIGGWVYANILKDFSKKEFTSAWIYTSSRNKANQRSLSKSGFQYYGSGISVKWNGSYFPLKQARF